MTKAKYETWLSASASAIRRGRGLCLLGACVLSLWALPSQAAETAQAKPSSATLRVDYYHSGGLGDEIWSLDRVVIEPLPWPGNPDRPLDTTELGKYRFRVLDQASGRELYSRGFASIYGEWETTAEAKAKHRTFHESLRFPLPPAPVRVVVERRGADQAFVPAWTLNVDPSHMTVDSSTLPRLQAMPIHYAGEPGHKLDLLFLGDGYTAEECATFAERARHLTEVLFSYQPFTARRGDINVWGLCPPAAESGVSRPSIGVHRRSPVGATYDAFGSERYVLTFDNRAFRDLAAWAPYDVVEILINGETYGGGGIFGQFSTVAADNSWADYVFIHELGHHLAALADEYYTSAVAYELDPDRPEPWERNATALHDPEALKWRDLVASDTPIPTPWPKQRFESQAAEIQQRRRQIRAANRPESEMSALFEEQSRREVELIGAPGRVGAYEGANYSGQGYYRPEVDCVMFSRNDVPFCRVCRRAIEEIIDLYVLKEAPVAEGEGR